MSAYLKRSLAYLFIHETERRSCLAPMNHPPGHDLRFSFKERFEQFSQRIESNAIACSVIRFSATRRNDLRRTSNPARCNIC